MTIKGSILTIRFRNQENGYTIANVDSGSEVVCVVGNFPPCTEGQTIECEGEYVVHATFGRQFKVYRVDIQAPENKDSIVKFLSSGLIKGIGPKTAESIVAKFGMDTMDIIDLYPHRLTEIRGINNQKMLEIAKSAGAVKSMQKSIIFLQDKGLGVNLAMKVFEVYGDKTSRIILQNPYKLVEDIDGIGFVTADKIAKEIGIAFDSPFRVRAGLVYILRQSALKDGNTYLPYSQAMDKTVELLELDDGQKVQDIANELMIDYKLRIFDIDDTKVIMGANYYQTEKQIATKLLELYEQVNIVDLSYQNDIMEYERANNIKLHDNQIKAVGFATRYGVCVITGGPGTGKTTIINNILKIFIKNKMTVALLAPTGRAAKRITESTGQDASTIHRALMQGAFVSSKSIDKIDASVIIVDEVSMVDVMLFRNLLNAISKGTKLILVGDKDQLPSVGAGNVLRDILTSGVLPVVQLSFIYRQGDSSLIAKNAHNINSGTMPELSANNADFFFVKVDDSNLIGDTVVDLVVSRLPRYLNIEQSKVQVLCALKKGGAGVENLNRVLQSKLNLQQGQRELVIGEQVFRVGDKVMHTENNYNLKWYKNADITEHGKGVFNGDMGVIYDIKSTNELEVQFEDGRVSVYGGEDRLQLSLAYAITIHKSQGSEFDVVVMPVVFGGPMMMTRNLLYTGITRAKKLVVLVGSQTAIKRMVDNNYIALRYSSLGWFLKKQNLIQSVIVEDLYDQRE